ncbi:hypothetical protein AB7V99_19225 [Providencia rettgeri]|nr:hypothetical protein [Providencia rettgeri]
MDNIVPEYEFRSNASDIYFSRFLLQWNICSRQIILMLLSMKDTEFETIFCDYVNEQIEKYYQRKKTDLKISDWDNLAIVISKSIVFLSKLNNTSPLDEYHKYKFPERLDNSVISSF